MERRYQVVTYSRDIGSDEHMVFGGRDLARDKVFSDSVTIAEIA